MVSWVFMIIPCTYKLHCKEDRFDELFQKIKMTVEVLEFQGNEQVTCLSQDVSACSSCLF